MDTKYKSRIEFGKESEELAVKFLRKNGYSIVARNLRLGRGEIDIIATIDDIICFIEVKASSSIEHGLPEEQVGFQKQRQLIKLAKMFLQRNPEFMKNFDSRFDVIGISKKAVFQRTKSLKTNPPKTNPPKTENTLSHIIDAFRLT